MNEDELKQREKEAWEDWMRERAAYEAWQNEETEEEG